MYGGHRLGSNTQLHRLRRSEDRQARVAVHHDLFDHEGAPSWPMFEDEPTRRWHRSPKQGLVLLPRGRTENRLAIEERGCRNSTAVTRTNSRNATDSDEASAIRAPGTGRPDSNFLMNRGEAWTLPDNTCSASYTPPSVRVGATPHLHSTAGTTGGTSIPGRRGLRRHPEDEPIVADFSSKATPQRWNLRIPRRASGSVPVPKPPYGRVTAINLNTGEHARRRTVKPPESSRVELLLLGQAVVTKTLLFVTETRARGGICRARQGHGKDGVGNGI